MDYTLHLPDNIKIHFAGAEVQNQYIAARTLGVSYSLYTCYPWVERKLFEKAKSPIMPLKWQKEDTAKLVPTFIHKSSIHAIQDSGLFTLMFGSQKDVTKDETLINRWYDGMIEFTLNHGAPVTCVECDCQKILGVEKAWEFRYRMRRDLPNNRIINVFHLEDGKNGLDRLIEYSDYIAISVPELRFAGRSNKVLQLALYIKNKKPEIDIHLLAYKWLEFNGFNHLWYSNGFCFFGEERIHFNVTQKFKVGFICDITHFGEWRIIPQAGIRFDI